MGTTLARNYGLKDNFDKTNFDEQTNEIDINKRIAYNMNIY